MTVSAKGAGWMIHQISEKAKVIGRAGSRR
jgi:hypothetical protein